MFMCNCTLASPTKCFNCKNYSSSFYYGTSSENWFKYMGEVLGVNLDRYELVEKKDWKLNQLKKQLEEKKQSTEYYSKVIDKEINYLAELNKEIEQLESEINQLEEKKE